MDIANNWGKTLPERALINLPEHIKDRYPKIKWFGIEIENRAARKTVDDILKLLPENEIQCVCMKGNRSPVIW
ncbi:uncharacterized protein N7496_002204 [Penicillium cataractarum]|uniref:Uncharacterized protein n=1 Tax=Penicillium cataractarum TaxID=2100454 RepID=A0A9W9SJJ2_9EURO|nr:uncharacterized protein N7496_002204 [Penicillium cataractarum]KAJ5379776.1 hypothetical protein N7496_002204 [Penicillium cataractarum]